MYIIIMYSVHIVLICASLGEEGRENEQDEEEEESDSDSDWSSEDESDEEGFDDSVCPSGCDQTLFDLAIDMREKRMDLEELLAGDTYNVHVFPHVVV